VPGVTDKAAGGDLLLPFLIDARSIRGRLVRLGPAIASITGDHGYPPVVSHRLAEAIVLAGALAGALKFEGVFTLQIQSDGAIPFMVVDVTSAGDIRGYARYDADKLANALARETDQGPVARFLGQGYLAFTVDQGPETERYQGIVELVGESLAECAQLYFQQSEQLETAIKLAASETSAAVLMIQRMPLGPNSPIMTADEAAETWNRAQILLASATDSELLDLAPQVLLHRLYHQEQLEIHDPRILRAHCRCSAERVENTLRSFPRSEIESLTDEQDKVVVTCEYCKSTYYFDRDALERLYAL